MVQLVGGRSAEDVLEGSFERLGEVPVGDVDDVLAGQGRYPRAVVEHLGNDLPRGLVALEFQQVQAALGVDREQVEPWPERSDHLAADHQQPFAQERRVTLQELVEILLRRQRRGSQRPRLVAVDAPHSHLNRHASQPPIEGLGLEGLKELVVSRAGSGGIGPRPLDCGDRCGELHLGSRRGTRAWRRIDDRSVEVGEGRAERASLEVPLHSW